MDNYYNPAPIDREIKVNPSLVLMSKINKDGIIEYINHSFSEISGYEEFEIIGESIDLLRHPDMPRMIYEMLMERFEKNQPTRLINKMLAKDGRFFWVISDYESRISEQTKLVAHYVHSFAAPTFAVHKVDSLYKILSNIEIKSGSTETSKKYFIGFLEERNMTYDQFIKDLSITRPEYDQPFPNTDFVPGRPQNITQTQPDNILTTSPVAPKITAAGVPTKKPKSFLKQVFGK